MESSVSNTRAGTVEACQRSKLSLPIGGQIAKLHVDEGEEVVAGQLLMSLWNEDRAAQVEQAKAIASSMDKERQSICIASASDARESQRLLALVEKNLVSSERADLALAKSNASAAACEAAKARAGTGPSQCEIGRGGTGSDLSARSLRRTGRRSDRRARESSPLPSPPGVQTPPAIDLLTDDCHYISAPIDEVDASQIAIGMPVRVTMDAFRQRNFPANGAGVFPPMYWIWKSRRARLQVEADLDARSSRCRFYWLAIAPIWKLFCRPKAQL